MNQNARQAVSLKKANAEHRTSKVEGLTPNAQRAMENGSAAADDRG